MTYDEAKRKAFATLIPRRGTLFSCPSSDHHGGSFPAEWEVGGEHGTTFFPPTFETYRVKPTSSAKFVTWTLSDYWKALNSHKAKVIKRT